MDLTGEDIAGEYLAPLPVWLIFSPFPILMIFLAG